MRHAEAVEKSHHHTDKDRELSSTGIQQSIKMGAYLASGNMQPEMIFCSPAERAKETAALVAERFKLSQQQISEADLYDASVRTFLDFINKLDSIYNNVLCVGHNPTLSYLAEYITKAEIGSMSPGSVAIIRFNISSWVEVSQGSGELLNYITPETISMI